uniref:C3H1-type domain-containing protein n=1 Tax=Meloidogyne incognita TaxID=6306 RepID=A0A914MSE9_MELIC
MENLLIKNSEKSPETAEGQRRQISPGPPGLDEGGSPPPSLEQQQQKSPSSVQIPQSIQQPFSSVSPSIMINQQQQQPNLPPRQISLEEAKEIAGSCQFYKRTGTCNFGERCKFAHDDEHLTFGVQMAMRGVSMPNRGGFRGSRGGGNSVGRAGGARDSPKVDAEGGSGRFEKRTSRRAAGSDSNGRRLDYDISPVRGGGSEDISVKGNRDRRYRRTSPQRRRGHSRSRSRDRYSRRRRSSSRSRNGRRRAKSSSSSSSSRSASSVSRASTPQKDRNRKRSRSRTPTRRRRDYSRQRYRRDYYRRRSPPRHRSSSSSSNRRRRRSSSSSSSASQEKRKNNKVKNSCDTDSGSPILVLSDETVKGEKNNVTASDSLPMEENKE